MTAVAISLSLPASRNLLKQGSFLACWQAQAKLSTLVMFGLIAYSVWIALAVMLVWSIVATFIYYAARQRGVPDVLANPAAGRGAAMRTGQILGGLWMVGINAFAFANVVRPLLREGVGFHRLRLVRGGLLTTGLILFGVTINQHMLQCAGYKGARLLALSTFGSFLNVPYRIFSGAITLHLLVELTNLNGPTSYI